MDRQDPGLKIQETDGEDTWAWISISRCDFGMRSLDESKAKRKIG